MARGTVLPRNWKDLWFFHATSPKHLGKISSNGLLPHFWIDPDPSISGHFSSLKRGLEFVDKYGDMVLFFTQDPYQASRYMERGDEVMLRFALPSDLDPKSIYEDSTGYFGVVRIPPHTIEVNIDGDWEEGLWVPITSI